jgi:ADP-ribose pyrophosphatase YjhB (NUDIX family)
MDLSIILQVGVKIFLKNKSGRFLLLKRSPVRYPTIRNLWDIPGGRINPGSTLFENIRREIFEETELRISEMPKLIFAQDILRSEKHIVRLTFVGSISGNREPVLDDDHSDFKWVTLKEMEREKELDEFTREVLKKCF